MVYFEELLLPLQCIPIFLECRDRVEVMTVYRHKVVYQRPYFFLISFNSMSSAK